MDASSDRDEAGTPETETPKAVNMMTGKGYELMPCPVVIDSGASEHVMPKHWCPQAALGKGESADDSE